MTPQETTCRRRSSYAAAVLVSVGTCYVNVVLLLKDAFANRKLDLHMSC